MDKMVLNWVKSSDYDIATAEAMLKSKRYVYVIFFCHLSLEKLLKAVVCKVTQKIAPKTHDLIFLKKLAEIEVPKEHRLLVAHLNSASIPTRYPEDISKMSRQYNQAAAKKYLKETKELRKWLKQNQKLNG
jgi:HEPN domain-containing protein